MLLPFQFEAERHLYTSPGYFVLSTSAIKQLNGLDEVGQIPSAVLEQARCKGEALDTAVQELEALILAEKMSVFHQSELDPDSLTAELYADLLAYLDFRKTMDFVCIHPCQKGAIYLHEYADQAIGGHIDLRGFIKGKPFIIDLKRRYPVYGKAKKQMRLAWRMQLQSYKEITMLDEDFWKAANTAEPIQRAILHLHPKLKRGWEFIDDFQQDDEALWGSMVLCAKEKLASGFELNWK